jgi:hypothetical protein
MIKKILIFIISFSYLFGFYIGVGEFSACKGKYGSESSKFCPFIKRKPLYTFLKKEAPNVNAISMWITRNWKENWYPAKTINKFIKQGFTPIFIFYWFEDQISPAFVKKHKKEYFEELEKFAKFLQKIKGKKIVILNPEYNENGMQSSRNFDILQAKSILLIKKYDKNTLVGICPGDFGNYNVIWDKYNWDLLKPSMNYSAKLSDFIAFQEMRAITRDTKQQILDTPLRALAFATYLHQTYHKPTFLGYLAISSYKTLKIQATVMKNFAKILPLMKHSADLIGINLFHYIDVPGDKGYFKKGQEFFGIKFANGKKKPSFKYFLKFK